MNESELLASRRLNELDLNVRDEEIALKHYWCRVVWESNERHNTRPHRHSFFELHLCLTGYSELEMAGQRLRLEPEQFLLLPPHQQHIIRSQSPDFSKFVWGFSVRQEDAAAALEAACQKAALHRVQSEFLRGLGVVLDNSLNNDFEYHNVIRDQLYYLFVLLMRQLTDLQTKGRIKKNPSVQLAQIRKFLRDNLSTNPSVEDIGDQFSLSRKQLTRICMEEAGLTVTALKHSLQMEQIRQLLTLTNLSLEEIAQATGFADQYSMSKFFHRYEGQPPGIYRRSVRK